MWSKEDIVWRNIVETCLTSNEKMFIQSIIPKNKLSPEMIDEIKEKIVCLKRFLHFNPNTPEALSEIQLREIIFLNDLLKAIKYPRWVFIPGCRLYHHIMKPILILIFFDFS